MKKSIIFQGIFIFVTILYPLEILAQQNIAKGKTAKQSSGAQTGRGSAANAVDGYTSGVWTWDNNTITHTNDENNPWWEVDLGGMYDISEIKIWNRTDNCCWNRLQNFHVMVSEDPVAGISTTAIQYVQGPLHFNSASEANKSLKNEARGRYVRIFIAGNKKTLSLAEVEVFGTPATIKTSVNIAKGKTAKQSSDAFDNGNGTASKAVDGNTGGGWSWSANTITHTRDENNPWWEVDLGRVHDISKIEIWNRTDACCWERLQNFFVMVSENSISGNSTRQHQFQGGAQSFTSPNHPSMILEGNKRGRYVRIFISGNNKTLSLAEVEVFGRPALPTSTSIIPDVLNAPQLFPFGSEGQRKVSEVAAGKEINLEVMFVDWPDRQATSNNFDGLWNSITSNGQMFKAFKAHGLKVNVNLHKSGWKRMPKNITHYFPTSTASTNWNWKDYTKHSVELLGSGADFSSNTIAVVVPNKGINGFKSVGSGAHGARNFRGIRKMITLVPQVYNEHYTTLMHEIGHCFGSGELYPASSPYLHEVAGYDLMGDVVYATGFMGWHRYRYGWLGKERLQFLSKKGSTEIALKKISSSSGKAMVVIPDPDKLLKYWVIEIGQDVVSRKQFKAGRNGKLNAEGDRVIVSTVEHPEILGKRAIRLVPRTKFFGEHGTVDWLDRVSYKSGQSSQRNDMPFTFSVGSKSSDGFALTVNLKKDIPHLTFPEDQVSRNGQYKLSVTSDGNLGIYRTANNAYVWDAKNKLFPGKPISNTWVALRNGNIQLVDAHTGKALGEKTVGAPAGSQFKVSDDGKLLIVGSSGKEVWKNK